MEHYGGVILDVDGTLVDSNDAHTHAWCDALAAAGHAVPFERVRPLIGMGGDKLLPEACGVAADSPEGKAIAADRAERFMRDYFPTVKPFPGARELLVQLRDAGLKLVVASSAKDDELGPLLHLVGAEHLLSGKTSKDDVARSKPDPDAVHVALGKLGMKAGQAVMLGDTPYDLEAATRAGVAFIGFTAGGWQARDLAGAIAVYAGPAELLAEFPGSALARRQAS